MSTSSLPGVCGGDNKAHDGPSGPQCPAHLSARGCLVIRRNTDPSSQRYPIGSISFNPWTLEEAIAFFTKTELNASPRSKNQNGISVHFANAYNIALAQSDPQYKQLLEDADFVFADGTPVVWAAKKMHQIPERNWVRVYGPDFMRGVLSSSLPEHRHFLLGSTDTTLQALTSNIRRDFPNANLIGVYSPPFVENPDPVELEYRDSIIRAAQPTHIWVGLGTPKQDYEVRRLAEIHPAAVFAVGAAFDYLSGTATEAPALVKSWGLQWLHRLLHEPRRLTRRYLWGNPRFLLSVARTHSNHDKR